MKGTSKNSQICPQRTAVRCNAVTDLFSISSLRRNAEPVTTYNPVAVNINIALPHNKYSPQ